MQAAGEKDIHHVAVILLEASIGRRNPPGDIERLGDKRREAFHQNSRNECNQHEIDVCVEGANPWTKIFVVEPWRFFKIFEKIAQGLRRPTQGISLPLYTCPDESVQVVRRQRGEFRHYRVQLRVAYSGMLDVVVSHCLVVETGLLITLKVRRW